MCESQNQDIVVTKFVNVVWRSCESVYDWKNYLSQFIPSFSNCLGQIWCYKITCCEILLPLYLYLVEKKMIVTCYRKFYY